MLAPWLYSLAQNLAAHHWPVFEKLATNPFRRFVNRAMLGVALAGIWPLLRSTGMRRWRDVGLAPAASAPKRLALGFLTGFVSLACVAAIALLARGRVLNPEHSLQQFVIRGLTAALSAIIVAVLEELLFRGTLFGILRKMSGWPIALVFSSAVYALVHFIHKADVAEPVTWLSGIKLLPKMFEGGMPFIPALLTLSLAGSILALAYQRTGTLFFSIGLHAGWIFWLKFYGFLTVIGPRTNPTIWGTDSLIDGWLTVPILSCTLWFMTKGMPAQKQSR